jgi:hypothetical protein
MCALHWSWAFGNEDLTDLSAMGWTTADPTVLALTTDTDKVYSYSGSPTRYGWIFDGNYGEFTLPIPAVSGLDNGWIAAPWKSSVGSGYYTLPQPLLRIVGTSGERIECSVTSGGAIALYVSNTLKETSAVVDWTEWRYIALRWDMSTNPWSGQVYVDGVAVTALGTQSDVAETAGSARIGPGPGVFNLPTAFCSQIIIYDSTADAGETPYYATRAEPIADGTNIGSWAPNSGSDDYAVVASPFDETTFTEDSSPSPSNRVEVVSSHISASIGIVPNTIVGVTGHTFSDGQNVTSRVVLSPSGGTEVSGSGVLISSGSVSYAFASDDGTYLPSDSVDLIYEIVST